MIVTKYEEWLEMKIGQARPDEVFSCPSCDGVGERQCHECGSDTSCDDCDGEGYVKFKYISKHDYRKVFGKQVYVAELKKDLEAWARWTDQDRIETLVSGGLIVWTRLIDKQEEVRIS